MDATSPQMLYVVVAFLFSKRNCFLVGRATFPRWQWRSQLFFSFLFARQCLQLYTPYQITITRDITTQFTLWPPPPRLKYKHCFKKTLTWVIPSGGAAGGGQPFHYLPPVPPRAPPAPPRAPPLVTPLPGDEPFHSRQSLPLSGIELLTFWFMSKCLNHYSELCTDLTETWTIRDARCLCVHGFRQYRQSSHEWPAEDTFWETLVQHIV